jgi:uncharacterized damage-inducible protein DinB
MENAEDDTIQGNEGLPEPWLHGTLADVPAVARAVLHSLELAAHDVRRWCEPLSLAELEAQPFGLPAAAYHLRHIARSLDRLLTYAEGRQLDAQQVAALRSELLPSQTRQDLLEELACALATSGHRVRDLAMMDLEQPRFVGTRKLPATLGGLLVHLAEHTQRHVGQAVTTTKLLVATRQPGPLAIR